MHIFFSIPIAARTSRDLTEKNNPGVEDIEKRKKLHKIFGIKQNQ